MESGDVIKLVLLGVALLFSGFFSASEAAFLSLQRGKIAALSKTNAAKAERISRFSSRPEKLLATVLTGNNLANTAAAALGTGVALSYLEEGQAVLASTVVVTVVLLIFAEAIPKTIATRYSIGFASLVSRPLRLIELILLPPIWMLERLVKLITGLFGMPQTSIVSPEEIQALIELGAQAGAVQESQAELLSQVFRIEDRRVSEAMTHRTQVVGVEAGTTLREFLKITKQSRHSRYPVYVDSLDNITGILSVHDVLSAISEDDIDLSTDVTTVAGPAIILPESKRIGSLFSELRTIGSEMYILVDEHGGVIGIATLRQLVGEIVESYDLDDHTSGEDFVQLPEGGFLVRGEVSIDDVRHETGVMLPRGPYETLAGYIIDQMGRIPDVGETFSTSWFNIEVTKMSGLRVTEAELTIVPTVAPAP